MTQIKYLKDTITNQLFYPVTHVKAIIGLEKFLDGEIIDVTEEELLSFIKSSLLIPGTKYRIVGYTSTPNPSLGLTSAGHKIDLIVTALSTNLLHRQALATYNTDETDSFYEDNGVLVSEWEIEVSICDSDLGLALGMDVAIQEPTSLYIGLLHSIAHNGTDTLIAVYNYTDKIAISQDGGLTFYTHTLPYAYGNVSGILYGNNTFVIFDEEGNLCVSKDNGLTWLLILSYRYETIYNGTGASSTYRSGFCSSCFGNDQFYIIGNRVGIKSSDGLTWQPFDWGYYDPGWYRPAIAAGDGIVGITAYNFRIMWSFDDCSTWTNSLPVNNYWIGICFGNHMFSITAGNQRGCIVTNTDSITSITWPDGTYNGGIYTGFNLPGKVSYNNGVFYCFDAYNEAGNYAYSLDGLQWTLVLFPKTAYPGDYGHCRAAFGPNGEMYIADVISNSIWVNPTPTQGDTWRILSPTGIDKFQYTLQASNLTIVIPNEPSSYYLSLGGNTFTAYKFPMELSSSGVIYDLGKFHTILYNYINNKAYYSTSRNGVSWSLTEFPYETTSPCQALVLAEGAHGALCVFEGGLMYWINGDLIFPINHSGESQNKSYVIYNKYNNTFLYALKGADTLTIYLLNLENETPVVTTYTLPQATVISNLSTAANFVYVSGYKSGSTTTTYTHVINLNNSAVENISLSGYITTSAVSGLKLIVSTSTNNLALIVGKEVTVVPDVEVSGVYASKDNILCLIVGNDLLNVLNYAVVHTLQISKLTDEFNNTCFFDFKNLRKYENGEERAFFDHNGSDYSLSGNVLNFKQLSENSSLPIYSTLKVGGVFNHCSITGDLVGTFEFPHGASMVNIAPIGSCDFSEVPVNLLSSRHKEVWSDKSKIYIKEDTGNLLCFTINNGLNWHYEYNPIIQFDTDENALASTSFTGNMYFTDNQNIVVGGKIYGIGNISSILNDTITNMVVTHQSETE